MCYIYDVLSRVVRRTTIDSANGFETCENYGSNPAGNLTLTGDESFRYDDNNRLISYKDKTVSYDADGNMLLSPLGGSTMGFSYDSDNHLISAGTTTYTYDVENTRARIYCGESITSCTYNTNARLSQLLVRTVDGVITKYVYGLGLIDEESDGKFKTYHFDYRGSTVAITDENGAVTDTFEYETYGRLTSRTGTTDTPFLYNGRDGVMSDANGLYYMRARYYSPELKRFINADIVAGDISNAITLNRYAYANGNPVSNVDPFGLSAERGGPAVTKWEKNKSGNRDIRTNWYYSEEEAAYYFGVEHNQESIEHKNIDGTVGREYYAVIYSKVFYGYNDSYYTITEIAKMAAHGEISSMKDFLIACRKNGGIVRLYSCGDYKGGSNRSVANINFEIGTNGRIEAVVHTHGAPGGSGESDENFSEGGNHNDYFGGGDKLLAEDIYNYGVKFYQSAMSLNSRDLAPKGRGIDDFMLFLITPSGAIKRYRPGIDPDSSVYNKDITDEIPHTELIYPRR